MLTSTIPFAFVVHITGTLELTNLVQLTTRFTTFADHSSSLTSSTVGSISCTSSCGSVHIVDVVISPLGVGIFFLQPLC